MKPKKIDDYGNLMRKQIINKINEEINKPWSTACRQNGKKIHLPMHWKQPVRDMNICEIYRKKGWFVFHYMDGPTEEYIVIRHPKYFSYKG